MNKLNPEGSCVQSKPLTVSPLAWLGSKQIVTEKSYSHYYYIYIFLKIGELQDFNFFLISYMNSNSGDQFKKKKLLINFLLTKIK